MPHVGMEFHEDVEIFIGDVQRPVGDFHLKIR
jgi:hypothetical protein